MKVNVIKDKCIGCGNCVALTEGQIFDFNDEGLAETIVDVVPEDMEETAKDAIVQCPTEAIVEINEEETAEETIEE
jgi:ferredoxin